MCIDSTVGGLRAYSALINTDADPDACNVEYYVETEGIIINVFIRARRDRPAIVKGTELLISYGDQIVPVFLDDTKTRSTVRMRRTLVPVPPKQRAFLAGEGAVLAAQRNVAIAKLQLESDAAVRASNMGRRRSRSLSKRKAPASKAAADDESSTWKQPSDEDSRSSSSSGGGGSGSGSSSKTKKKRKKGSSVKQAQVAGVSSSVVNARRGGLQSRVGVGKRIMAAILIMVNDPAGLTREEMFEFVNTNSEGFDKVITDSPKDNAETRIVVFSSINTLIGRAMTRMVKWSQPHKHCGKDRSARPLQYFNYNTVTKKFTNKSGVQVEDVNELVLPDFVRNKKELRKHAKEAKVKTATSRAALAAAAAAAAAAAHQSMLGGGMLLPQSAPPSVSSYLVDPTLPAQLPVLAAQQQQQPPLPISLPQGLPLFPFLDPPPLLPTAMSPNPLMDTRPPAASFLNATFSMDSGMRAFGPASSVQTDARFMHE